jgi:hypothetical protein
MHGRPRPSDAVLRRHLVVWSVTLTVVLLTVGALAYRRWRYGAPHFAYTVGRTPDELLSPVQDPHPGVDMNTTTPDDYAS